MVRYIGRGQSHDAHMSTAYLTATRVNDWIHGVRAAAPEKDVQSALQANPLYESERLRVIYQLITNAPEEGGAGISPGHGEWEGVQSIFALHDHNYNKEWIKRWSKKWVLTPQDLDEIRDRLGEAVRICDT